jgi:hypothetical protein
VDEQSSLYDNVRKLIIAALKSSPSMANGTGEQLKALAST